MISRMCKECINMVELPITTDQYIGYITHGKGNLDDYRLTEEEKFFVKTGLCGDCQYVDGIEVTESE